MEQIRIVKEMRDHDRRNNGRADFMVRPRYMVWENVPGAFSSGTPKGSDFAAVIEEIIKVCESDANVCVCVPDNGWTKSGCYYAEDGSWSIAWRLHDAQFWGVPQRRKRISLVADFAGLSAPEILFERKGLSGHFEQSKTKRKDFATETESSTGSAISFQERAGKPGGGKGILIQNEHIGALSTLNNQSVLRLGVDFYNQALTGEATATLTSIRSDCDHVPCVMTVQAFGEYKESDKSSALKQRDYKDATDLVVCGVDTYNQTITGDVAATLNAASCDSPTHSGPSVLTSPTIVSSAYKGPGNTQDGLVTVSNDQVRRLTPLECERLQGFPDGWTDIGEWTDSKGKKHKDADSPRYKALGNSIALPFWFWLLRRISSQYERPATLASLFDGIGGFPLCWEKCNGKGTAIWASEIEEFPIAVTKKHFPEEGDD